jgi:hypothetical protein
LSWRDASPLYSKEFCFVAILFVKYYLGEWISWVAAVSFDGAGDCRNLFRITYGDYAGDVTLGIFRFYINLLSFFYEHQGERFSKW